MNLGSFVEPIPRNFLFLLGGESEIIICLDVRIDSGANCPALLIDNGVMSVPLVGTNGTENELGVDAWSIASATFISGPFTFTRRD